jgi:hypothetical protein
MNKIINSINSFCKVRNLAPAIFNGNARTPRVQYIIRLLKRNNITFEVDKFTTYDFMYLPENKFFNIILKGNSEYIVIAHHDIANPNSDNANDNSASVINAIYLKSIMPNITVVITDGEEMGRIGAKRLASQIRDKKFGNVKGVINLELTGIGGDNFIIGNYPGKLMDRVLEIFDPPVIPVPPNDSIEFFNKGIDTILINSLPILKTGTSRIKTKKGYLDNSSWYRCHSIKDSIDTIKTEDMKKFVDNVLVRIIKGT